LNQRFVAPCRSFTARPYAFRPLARDDLPLLANWLRAPEVTRWWGDPDEEFALIEEDLDAAAMAQWIVSFEEAPFAYAQAYEVHAWPQSHLAHLPSGAMAVDAFIGEPGMIDRGHGARFLRLLADELIGAGAPLVVIDPDAGNRRARRAYRKAGFRGDAVVETSGGSAVLMVFDQAKKAAGR
jgi:aminoglycoside 6'-N-acetyltransferase